jgi:hypothetical protein
VWGERFCCMEGLPSENALRVAKFELAMISLYHSPSDIHPIPRVALGVEVTSSDINSHPRHSWVRIFLPVTC